MIKFDIYDPYEIIKQIAMRVREKRLMLNLTQQALAKKSGVSLGTLKRFENKFEISLRYLILIAIALQSTEEFNQLFSKVSYKSLDDVIQQKKSLKRIRGSAKNK